jgi:hypothetical protein
MTTLSFRKNSLWREKIYVTVLLIYSCSLFDINLIHWLIILFCYSVYPAVDEWWFLSLHIKFNKSLTHEKFDPLRISRINHNKFRMTITISNSRVTHYQRDRVDFYTNSNIFNINRRDSPNYFLTFFLFKKKIENTK